MENISAGFLAEANIFLKSPKTFPSNTFSYFLEKGLYNSLQQNKHSKSLGFIENIINKRKNSGDSEDCRYP